MDWKILDTGSASAEENMRLDTRLLDSLAHTDQPIIHLYDWEGECATYGYFADPAHLLNMEEAREQGLSLARRPTGGGLIFHSYDLAFSVLVPADHPGFSLNTLENYNYINSRVAKAISAFRGGAVEPVLLPSSEEPAEEPGFCMAKPTVYDLVIEGRKVGGAAQRRTKHGYLHQGSICLLLPDSQKLKSLVASEVLEAMQKSSYPILNEEDLSKSRRKLKRLIIESLV